MLAGTHDKCQEMRGVPLSAWVKLIREHRGSFTKLFRELISQEAVNKVSFWTGNMFDKDKVPSNPLEWQSCSCCPYTCPTVQGLNWHMFKVHNVRNPDRALISSTSCAACLREFWTRERLVVHITCSRSKCKQYYRNNMPRLFRKSSRLLKRKPGRRPSLSRD